ncbi:DUF167 family protein [Kordiimonas sp.]|uniref:DUF167 family protein n=1 Tax=Kordiimonas sp. TaxID=1970157 RepID=UPI003A94855C
MSTDVFEATEGGIRLHIRLTPNARSEMLDRLEPSADGTMRLRASVTVVPEKGKANKALVKLLAKKLRLPKSAIRLIAGEQSRNKTIFIDGHPDELIPALEKMLSSLG